VPTVGDNRMRDGDPFAVELQVVSMRRSSRECRSTYRRNRRTVLVLQCHLESEVGGLVDATVRKEGLDTKETGGLVVASGARVCQCVAEW
jgi:hypothetical protein